MKNHWINLLINGVISLFIGITFSFLRIGSMPLITKILGYSIITSGLAFGVYFVYTLNKGKTNFITLLEGSALVAIGLFMLIKPNEMLMLILLLIGIWVVISGLIQVYYTFIFRNLHKYNYIMLVTGLLSINTGLVLSIKHEITSDLMGTIFGIINLVSGIVMLYFSLVNYRHSKKSKAIEVREVVNLQNES